MTLFTAFADPQYLSAERGWTETLRKINLGLFCALPLLLLFWRGGADGAATLIGVSFLAAMIAQRQWSLMKWPVFAVILILWLVLNLLISPLGINPLLSFSRSLTWLRLPLVMLAACLWLVRSREDLRLVALVWALTLGLTILDGLVQLLTGTSLSGRPIWENSRLTGPLDRPNIGMFAARIGFPLLAAAALLLPTGGRQRQFQLIIAAATLITLVFIVLTGERAASMLSLIALASCVFAVIIIMPSYRILGLAAVAGAGAVLSGIVASSTRIADRLENLIAIIRDIGASHYGEIFGAALRIWQEYYVTGVGMKNFQDACELLTQMQMKHPCPQHPHNPYLEWLVETGLIGTAGYCLLVLMLLAALLPLLSRQSRLKMVGGFALGTMALLLFPLTASQSNFSNWPALLFWSSLALTMAAVRLALRSEMR